MASVAGAGEQGRLTEPPRFTFRPHPYQLDGIVESCARDASLLWWSQGIGKTMAAMGAAVVLLGEGEVDQVFVSCERNKVTEWVADFQAYTNLDVVAYRGDKKRRMRLLTELPQVVVMGYEKARDDGTAKVPGHPRKLQTGPLGERMVGRRLLWVFDEIPAKLSGRSSALYRSHEYLLRELRKTGRVVTIGLTASEFSKDPEGCFNYNRLLAPAVMPTVEDFELLHVAARDGFGRPIRYHHLGDADRYWPDQPTLRDRLDPILSIRKDTDPEVSPYLPTEARPRIIPVDLEGQHKAFYAAVEELANRGADPEERRRWWTVLRQVASYPLALTLSIGQETPTLAQQIVREVGEDFLRDLGSPKRDRLFEDLDVLLAEGRQVILFTWFGQSILPLYREDLEGLGVPFSIYHGQMSDKARDAEVERFLDGDARVMLSSDAAARGVNWPGATHVLNIETPPTYDGWRQRATRHRRAGVQHLVHCWDYLVRDTIEVAVAGLNVRRHGWAESLGADDRPLGEAVTAAERAKMLKLVQKEK